MAHLTPVLLIPVYNDWASCSVLLEKLDENFLAASRTLTVVLINDDSPVPPPEEFARRSYRAIESISILHLRINLSHQRAIAVGLCHLVDSAQANPILIMDSDGEDTPADSIRLLDRFEELGGATAVFAQRTRRSENWSFRLGYFLYRTLHLILTGIPVQMGNFSIIAPSQAARLVLTSSLWNHYAAAALHHKLALFLLPTHRGHRYFGASSMNTVSLVTHGLSAISVFAERVVVRILIGVITAGVLLVLALLGVVTLRLFTQLPIPGWTSTVSGLLLLLLAQLATAAGVLVFFLLSSRGVASVIPLRDYKLFFSHLEQRGS